MINVVVGLIVVDCFDRKSWEIEMDRLMGEQKMLKKGMGDCRMGMRG